MSNTSETYQFFVPGFTTQRQWCIYIVVSVPKTGDIKSIYVGKVGDNRDGCNPIISRIGNHFSHNKIHSQIRNKLLATEDYDYTIHFSTFGNYKSSEDEMKNKVNELERRMNSIMQSKILTRPNFKLENPYLGKGFLSLKIKETRKALIREDEVNVLETLADNALGSYA